jgi:hypothetical protein
MIKLPKLKKKIHSFLTKEEGKISKENLIKTGVIIASFSIGAALNAKQVHSQVTCDPDCASIGNPPDQLEHNNASCGGGHGNTLTLGYAQSTASGTHDNCIQSCHCSHGSHGSHGSHSSLF